MFCEFRFFFSHDRFQKFQVSNFFSPWSVCEISDFFSQSFCKISDFFFLDNFVKFQIFFSLIILWNFRFFSHDCFVKYYFFFSIDLVNSWLFHEIHPFFLQSFDRTKFVFPYSFGKIHILSIAALTKLVIFSSTHKCSIFPHLIKLMIFFHGQLTKLVMFAQFQWSSWYFLYNFCIFFLPICDFMIVYSNLLEKFMCFFLWSIVFYDCFMQ